MCSAMRTMTNTILLISSAMLSLLSGKKIPGDGVGRYRVQNTYTKLGKGITPTEKIRGLKIDFGALIFASLSRLHRASDRYLHFFDCFASHLAYFSVMHLAQACHHSNLHSLLSPAPALFEVRVNAIFPVLCDRPAGSHTAHGFADYGIVQCGSLTVRMIVLC